MKNIKTKLLALGMATMMVASATGCSFSFSFGGGKFSKASKKITNAAKEACDAEKASNKQRKAILKGSAITSGDFEDGAYCTLTSSEAENYELTLQCAEAGDLKNVTIFYKIVDNDGILSAVYELVDKDLAQDYYDELIDNINENVFSDERMEQLDYYSDHEWGIDDENDDEFMAFNRTEEGDGCDICYVKIDGAVVTYIYCSGHMSGDVYDEFFDFIEAAGCPDPESLV